MKHLYLVIGIISTLEEEDETIKGVSENDGIVIGSARFRILNVPSRPRALTKVKVIVKVNRWWDPSRNPRGGSQQVDRLRRRKGDASPR